MSWTKNKRWVKLRRNREGRVGPQFIIHLRVVSMKLKAICKQYTVLREKAQQTERGN